MTRQEAEAAVTKHGSQRAAAKALGVTRKAIQYALKKDAPQAAAPKGHRRTITEKDLLIETDAETRFRVNLTRLLRGMKRGEYMRDFDVRKDVGAAGDASLWREVRKATEFAPHVLEIGNGSDPAVYWGHRESVAGMIANGKAHKPAWAKE